MVSARQKKKDRIEAASLGVSTASLLVGIGALFLSLNKKGENKMAEQSPAMQRKLAKQRKKDAATARKTARMNSQADKMEKQAKIRQYARDNGYNGPIIMFNEKGNQKQVSIQSPSGEKQTYKLVPVAKKTEKPVAKKVAKPSKVASKPKSKTKPKAKSRDKKKWVAMEINRKTGGNVQAIVCENMEEAQKRALAMKKAHKKGSQPSKDCVQGYALVDTTKGIDVASCFFGYHDGIVKRV